MNRGGLIRQRRDECIKKLGGYPEWSPSLCQDLAAFADRLDEGPRSARQAFRELDAALQDPRWQAREHVQ